MARSVSFHVSDLAGRNETDPNGSGSATLLLTVTHYTCCRSVYDELFKWKEDSKEAIDTLEQNKNKVYELKNEAIERAWLDNLMLEK